MQHSPLVRCQVVSLDAGPGVAGTVDNIMEKVGLKENGRRSKPGMLEHDALF